MTRCPPRTSRSVMYAPIFPSPIIPSSIGPPELLPVENHAGASEILSQLRGVLKKKRAHPQLSRPFQVERPVVDENAFFRRSLGDPQRQPVDPRVRLPHTEKARAEERGKIIPQVEALDAVFVHLQRFIVQRGEEILPCARHSRENRHPFRTFLRLLLHELLEILRGERSRAVEDGAGKIFLQAGGARLEGVQHQLMSILEIVGIELEFLYSAAPLRAVPCICQEHATHIPKKRSDLSHSAPEEGFPGPGARPAPVERAGCGVLAVRAP